MTFDNTDNVQVEVNSYTNELAYTTGKMRVGVQKYTLALSALTSIDRAALMADIETLLLQTETFKITE
jgi:hypothetical protein